MQGFHRKVDNAATAIGLLYRPRSQARACGPATGNCCFIDILDQQTGAKITKHVNSNTQQQKRKKIGTITF